MGRTIPAYSIQLEILEKRLGSFRRGLRKEDQDILDDILRWGKSQVQSGALASCPNPSDPVFFSALIELKRDLNLQGRLLEELRGHPKPEKSAAPHTDQPGLQTPPHADLLKDQLKEEIKDELREEMRQELEEEFKTALQREVRKAIQEAASGDYDFF